MLRLILGAFVVLMCFFSDLPYLLEEGKFEKAVIGFFGLTWIIMWVDEKLK